MAQRAAIETVTFTTLYPNVVQPNHGIFVENRLRHLVASGRVVSRVVAPVPWFPFSGKLFGRYARYAAIPSFESRARLHIEHPKYVALPKLGMSLTPRTLFLAALPVLKRLMRTRDFDLIDAHYFYPDGVAAVWLGRALKKPVIVTARGSDVSLLPNFALPRRMILGAARGADGIIAVSQALKDRLVALGVPQERVTVLRNGVDLDLFRPDARRAAPPQVQPGPILLSVGELIARKGHDLVIAALPLLPRCTLLIAGEGPERSRLTALAARLNVSDRVRFLGSVPHDKLPKLYAASNALILASSREGWPNVLLEAMACGTPVVASNVWGNPEVVSAGEAGVLIDQRTPHGVANAIQRLLDQPPDRTATRRFAERFSWDATTAGQIQQFERILA